MLINKLHQLFKKKLGVEMSSMSSSLSLSQGVQTDNFNNIFNTPKEFQNSFDDYFQDKDISNYKYVDGIYDIGAFKGETLYGRVFKTDNRYSRNSPGKFDFQLGMGLNYGYGVYSLFESVRQHIYESMKSQRNKITVNYVVTYIGMTLPTPEEVSNHISSKTICDEKIAEYQRRGICSGFIHKLAIPMLKDYLSACGVKLDDTGNSIELAWEPKTTPNFPLPRAPEIKKPEAIGDRLYNAFTKEEMTDTTLQCEDGNIKCHALVLSLASEPLKKCFSSGFQEHLSFNIALTHHSKNHVKAAVEHIYTGNNPFTTSEETLDPIKMLALGHIWGLPALCDYAATIIGENVSPDQWKEVGHLGVLYESKYLLQVYNCYIIRTGEKIDEETQAVMNKLGVTIG